MDFRVLWRCDSARPSAESGGRSGIVGGHRRGTPHSQDADASAAHQKRQRRPRRQQWRRDRWQRCVRTASRLQCAAGGAARPGGDGQHAAVVYSATRVQSGDGQPAPATAAGLAGGGPVVSQRGAGGAGARTRYRRAPVARPGGDRGGPHDPVRCRASGRGGVPAAFAGASGGVGGRVQHAHPRHQHPQPANRGDADGVDRTRCPQRHRSDECRSLPRRDHAGSTAAAEESAERVADALGADPLGAQRSAAQRRRHDRNVPERQERHRTSSTGYGQLGDRHPGAGDRQHRGLCADQIGRTAQSHSATRSGAQTRLGIAQLGRPGGGHFRHEPEQRAGEQRAGLSGRHRRPDRHQQHDVLGRCCLLSLQATLVKDGRKYSGKGPQRCGSVR
eukprot:ctg_325.g79